MAQSKADSFTAYLEAKQRAEKAKQSPPASAGGTALSILAVLAGNAGLPMPLVPDLQTASGMTFSGFADAIKRLQETGYITLVGPPGSEVAQLTNLGAQVAPLGGQG